MKLLQITYQTENATLVLLSETVSSADKKARKILKTPTIAFTELRLATPSMLHRIFMKINFVCISKSNTIARWEKKKYMNSRSF